MAVKVRSVRHLENNSRFGIFCALIIISLWVSMGVEAGGYHLNSVQVWPLMIGLVLVTPYLV